MSEPVTLRWDGDVAVVSIDDGKANAVGFAMVDALQGALDQAEGRAGALVLVGRPGRFCAGFDLTDVRSERGTELLAGGGDLALRLLAFPAPVVMAATGHALALGAMLLLCADWRVGAAGDFRIGLTEVRIGMALPPFTSTLAGWRLSRRHVIAATQLATVYDPARAVDAGFLDEVVAADECPPMAVAVATQLAADLDGQAFAASRRNLRGELLDDLAAKVAGRGDAGQSGTGAPT